MMIQNLLSCDVWHYIYLQCQKTGHFLRSASYTNNLCWVRFYLDNLHSGLHFSVWVSSRYSEFLTPMIAYISRYVTWRSCIISLGTCSMFCGPTTDFDRPFLKFYRQINIMRKECKPRSSASNDKDALAYWQRGYPDTMGKTFLRVPGRRICETYRTGDTKRGIRWSTYSEVGENGHTKTEKWRRNPCRVIKSWWTTLLMSSII